MALRKLASQAHGETLTHLLAAWEQRQAEVLPSAQDLGKGVNAATRSAWAQSLTQAPQGAAPAALLRLQLLTRRNEPGPLDTWRQDVAQVLAAAHDGASARRLQNVLKQLLKR